MSFPPLTQGGSDVRFNIAWTLRGWRERYLYTKIPLAIAHMLPRWLRYWVTIDSIAKATNGKYGNADPCRLPAMDVLDRI